MQYLVTLMCGCVWVFLCVCVDMCDSLGYTSEGQLHIQSRFSTRLHEGHAKLLLRDSQKRGICECMCTPQSIYSSDARADPTGRAGESRFQLRFQRAITITSKKKENGLTRGFSSVPPSEDRHSAPIRLLLKSRTTCLDITVVHTFSAWVAGPAGR